VSSAAPDAGPDDKVGPVTEKNPPGDEDRKPDPDDDGDDDEAIDEADEESFPASDSPSSWSGPPGSSD
jgi:hypothetical protein